MSRKIVIPGELVTTERKRLGQNVFLRDGKIFSDSVGFVEETDTTASVVALEGFYNPQPGDVVVGIVASEKFSVYLVDINSFYLSTVSKKELRDPLQPLSIVSAKVIKINELKEIELGNVRVLFGGEVFDVNPIKVPRVIGRNGSMLEILKKWTKANFFVGRNGKIWASNGNLLLLKLAVKMIADRAHEENLTNRIAEFLEKEVSKKEENGKQKGE